MRHLEALQRQAVVQGAHSWLGTPFHHQARVKGAGIDCLMLVAECFERPGLVPHIELVSSLENLTPEQQAIGWIFVEKYSQQWHLHQKRERALEVILQCGGHEIAGPPLPGDLALYYFHQDRPMSHGAIVIDWPRIIHAVSGDCVSWGDGEQVVILKQRGKIGGFFSYWGGG